MLQVEGQRGKDNDIGLELFIHESMPSLTHVHVLEVSLRSEMPGLL
jgi:hypothetical protein